MRGDYRGVGHRGIGFTYQLKSDAFGAGAHYRGGYTHSFYVLFRLSKSDCQRYFYELFHTTRVRTVI